VNSGVVQRLYSSVTYGEFVPNESAFFDFAVDESSTFTNLPRIEHPTLGVVDVVAHINVTSFEARFDIMLCSVCVCVCVFW
jgi:hypothetical protein